MCGYVRTYVRTRVCAHACVPHKRIHTKITYNVSFQMCDFLEKEYLEEQVKDIKELSNHVTNLRRVGPGLGEFMFDKETFESS